MTFDYDDKFYVESDDAKKLCLFLLIIEVQDWRSRNFHSLSAQRDVDPHSLVVTKRASVHLKREPTLFSHCHDV